MLFQSNPVLIALPAGLTDLQVCQARLFDLNRVVINPSPACLCGGFSAVPH